MYVIIYKITNTVDGKAYVGQTTKTFEERYNDDGKWWVGTQNCYLKSSAAKHGHENFTVEILEKDVKTIEELNDLETFYIKKYNTLIPNGYNFCYGPHNHIRTDAYGDRCAAGRRDEKTYKFKSPSGEIFEVINLSRFCREHKLTNGLMWLVDCGKARQHKGWTKPEVELKIMSFVSPEGEVFHVNEWGLTKFCKKHGIHRGTMGYVWSGKWKHHRGWTKLGNPKPEYVKDKKIMSPTGEIHIIKYGDFIGFCRENDLDDGEMYSVLNGKIINHKGWTKYEKNSI